MCRRDDLFLLFTDFQWKIGHVGGRLRKPLKKGAGERRLRTTDIDTPELIFIRRLNCNITIVD